jgi:hypothetical protein
MIKSKKKAKKGLIEIEKKMQDGIIKRWTIWNFIKPDRVNQP